MNRKELINQLEGVISKLRCADDPRFCTKLHYNRPKDISEHLLLIVESISKGDFNKNGSKWRED